MKLYWVAATVFLIFPRQLIAEEKILSVSPLSCVADKETGLCEIEVQISWQPQITDRVCLKITNDKSLHCFAPSHHTFQYHLKTKSAVELVLIKEKTKLVLDKVRLNVFHGQYRKRHRQRHAWSILL